MYFESGLVFMFRNVIHEVTFWCAYCVYSHKYKMWGYCFRINT